MSNGCHVTLQPLKNRTSHEGVLWQKVFLNILLNSQESTWAKILYFNKVAGLKAAELQSCFRAASEKNNKMFFATHQCKIVSKGHVGIR